MAEIKSLQEAIFKYPESKTGEIKDRDVFVISQDESDLFTISFHDMPEEEKKEVLDAAAKLNSLIEKYTKTKFRRFKKEKIVE